MHNSFDKLSVGEIINIQAYKYDGTLYRQWNGVRVLEISPESVVILMLKTKVQEKKGQHWTIREPYIWWFPLENWHNTTGLIRGTGIYYYTNIATPPIFEDNTIKFIDFDLDIKEYPNQPTKVVDQNEFKFNSEKMKYTNFIIKKSKEEVKNVLKLIKNQDSHFNEEVIKYWVDYLVDSKMICTKFMDN